MEEKPSTKPPAEMLAEAWDGELVEKLRSHFPDAIEQAASYLGQNFLVARQPSVGPVIRYLKHSESFEMLVDLTAVDYPKRELRFELVYELYSFARNERVRIKTRIKDGDAAQSLTDVHAGANWLEREVFDMFGIRFAGHPDLKRILLPEEWNGHPLRKDHSIVGVDNAWVQTHLGIESGQ